MLLKNRSYPTLNSHSALFKASESALMSTRRVVNLLRVPCADSVSRTSLRLIIDVFIS